MNRNAFLNTIRQNIARCGQHITCVSGDSIPRFAYSIGLTPDWGAELFLPGALYYDVDEVGTLINEIAAGIRAGARAEQELEIGDLGLFRLRRTHASWVKPCLLGALDLYRGRTINAYQIVPEDPHWTIDVPDTSAAWSPDRAPAWRWLRERWRYPIPADSVVATDLRALRGERITRMARWEHDYWEMFVDEASDERDLRLVPLGVLLGHDPSLRPAIDLKVDTALWRDDDDWQPLPTQHSARVQRTDHRTCDLCETEHA